MTGVGKDGVGTGGSVADGLGMLAAWLTGRGPAEVVCAASVVDVEAACGPLLSLGWVAGLPSGTA